MVKPRCLPRRDGLPFATGIIIMRLQDKLCVKLPVMAPSASL
ncbi:MAG: hypothetical protein U1E61_07395 [Bradyrhizobium sp.]